MKTQETDVRLAGSSPQTISASRQREQVVWPENFASRPSSAWRISDKDYQELRQAVYDLFSIDLAFYRTQQMERRLTSLLERRHCQSWQEYIALLQKDDQERRFFQEYLTINVSSFYRDAEKWDYLRKTILPYLFRLRGPAGIEAWSVGCSIGAEAYTLAMLLLDQEPARSHRVWGVDIDTKVLERAIAGGPYTRSEVKELPPHFLQKYMQVLDDNSYMVRPSVRTITNFQHFDLLQDVVERQFDLILCRNVVIYFTAQTKVDVYRRLRQALRPGGVLFIGSTETISRYREWGLEYIAPAFYRRKR